MSRFFCYKDTYGFDQIYERHKSRGEMTFSIEGVVQNPCLLAPPPFPKDFLDTAALQRLNDYRDTFSAWKTYVGECMNGTGPTTAELTSTSVSLSPVSNLTTPYLTSTRDTDLASTPIPVTPQPRQPQTPPDTNDVIVIAIIVSVVILLLIVLVVVIIYKYRPIRKKICGQSTNRSRHDKEDLRASTSSSVQLENGRITSYSAAEPPVNSPGSGIGDGVRTTSDTNSLQDNDIKIEIPRNDTEMNVFSPSIHFRKGGTISQEPLLDASVTGDDVDEGGSENMGFNNSENTQSQVIESVTDKNIVDSRAMYHKGGTLSTEPLIASDSVETVNEEVDGSCNSAFSESDKKEDEIVTHETSVSIDIVNVDDEAVYIKNEEKTPDMNQNITVKREVTLESEAE